jgi:hypothetical protein
LSKYPTRTLCLKINNDALQESKELEKSKETNLEGLAPSIKTNRKTEHKMDAIFKQSHPEIAKPTAENHPPFVFQSNCSNMQDDDAKMV